MTEEEREAEIHAAAADRESAVGEAAEKLDQARQQAHADLQKILATAREEYDRLHHDAEAAFEKRLAEAGITVLSTGRVAQQIAFEEQLARRTLADLTDEELEAEMDRRTGVAAEAQL